jgi:hypothetical protein
MGKVKQQLLDAIERGEFELKCGETDILRRERNREEHWCEEMPDLMGEALAQAEMDFLATVDLTAWEQLELDLWEGRHGINEQTYWDVAGRGSCE